MTDNAEPRLRLFTAIDFCPETKGELQALISRLQKGAQFTGSRPVWVAPENLHLTLVFLGSQTPEQIRAIEAAMAKAAGQAVEIPLRLGGLELFPTPKEPKVVSLGVHGKTVWLEQLRERLAQELREKGFEIENRAFRPHLTLARIKSVKGLAGLRDLVKSHKGLSSISLIAREITLFKSTLTAAGPVYEILHQAPLQKAPEPLPESEPAD